MFQCGNSAPDRRFLHIGINVVHCAVVLGEGNLMARWRENGLSKFQNIRHANHLVIGQVIPRWVFGLTLLMILSCFVHSAHAGEAPLVPLSAIDPSIRQDMRYASENNFTGLRVPGYDAGECWLKPAVARSLAKVQADLAAAHPDLSLKVFDCYRPRRSVQAFVAWAGGADDGKTQSYYPNVSRSALLALGYIGRSSNHSKGIAVDLTLVRRAEKAIDALGGGGTVAGGKPSGASRIACTDTSDQAFDANSLDMGTTFDCFDRKSHTEAAGLSDAQRSARQLLVGLMHRRGFKNYAKEWWHFTYGAADDGRSFDVPVVDAPVQAPLHGAPQPSAK